jgi:hypothetical protein
MTIELEDLEKIKDSALESFTKGVASVSPEIEAAKLESQLTQLYSLAAIAARREECLDGTARIWATMVSICDAFAAKISEVCHGGTRCVASYDRVLDVRNKCARLQELHS